MNETKIALKVNEKDNVATIFANGVVSGSQVKIRDQAGRQETVSAYEAVPYGHKIAVWEIKPGERIIKYGEEIGVATQNIRRGDYVHIHNLDSMRGRGDWEKGEK